MKRNSTITPSPIHHLVNGIERSVTTPLFRTLFRAPLKKARTMVDLLSA